MKFNGFFFKSAINHIYLMFYIYILLRLTFFPFCVGCTAYGPISLRIHRDLYNHQCRCINGPLNKKCYIDPSGQFDAMVTKNPVATCKQETYGVFCNDEKKDFEFRRCECFCKENITCNEYKRFDLDTCECKCVNGRKGK